jgi:hypothetical protein
LSSFIQKITHAPSEMLLRFRKLHSRIIFIFSVLLFLVLLAVLYSVNAIISNSTNQDILRNLDNGQQLFKHINEEDELRLTQTASILASDFAFREAIATEEIPSFLHCTIIALGFGQAPCSF